MLELSHEHFMREALREATKAFDRGEVPVGAVVVWNGRVIARGHNLTETLNDVTAHAEMQAITAASEHLGGKYLKECTLYVTLEPCTMCMGALFWSQVSHIVFGAADPKRGYQKTGGAPHPKTSVESGVLADECGEVLKNFFRLRRL